MQLKLEDSKALKGLLTKQLWICPKDTNVEQQHKKQQNKTQLSNSEIWVHFHQQYRKMKLFKFNS